MLSSLNNYKGEYDYIILHSTPDLWPSICLKERKINPNVIIYGITVWETETLPYMWDIYTNYVDKISVPSQFSSIAFKKFHTEVSVINHPVVFPNTTTIEFCDIYYIKENYNYIFYNISEFSNRKGIYELIETFKKLFKEDNTVLLYIKTFGRDTTELTNLPENIIINTDRVSDSFIDCIHKCGNCYISFTKAEGQGIANCQAGLYENHILLPKYSGYLDYFECGLDYFDYILEPATFCHTQLPQHSECGNLPFCKYFNLFVPEYHQFAKVINPESQILNSVKLKKKGSTLLKKHLIENFSLEKFRELFVKDLFSTKRKNITFPKTIKPNNAITPQLCYFRYTTPSKPKMCIIGSFKFGNVGDDTYAFIFKKYFEKEFQVTIVSDNETVNLDNFEIISKFSLISNILIDIS